MTRKSLPARRESYQQKLSIQTERGREKIYFTVGFFPDNDVAEIFILQNKTGDQERAYMDAVARSISLGLQHGVPLSRYVEMFSGTKFPPFGPVIGHEKIKFCSSPLGLLARWLGVEFLQRDDLGHVST